MLVIQDRFIKINAPLHQSCLKARPLNEIPPNEHDAPPMGAAAAPLPPPAAALLATLPPPLGAAPPIKQVAPSKRVELRLLLQQLWC